MTEHTNASTPQIAWALLLDAIQSHAVAGGAWDLALQLHDLASANTASEAAAMAADTAAHDAYQHSVKALTATRALGHGTDGDTVQAQVQRWSAAAETSAHYSRYDAAGADVRYHDNRTASRHRKTVELLLLLVPLTV